MKPTEQKSNINPEILQQMLESATNAAEKGQSQFFTPLELARQLTAGLPRCRPTAVDLNCGATALLQAAHTKDTFALLGSDIDPHRPHIEGLDRMQPVERIAYDATLLYGLLKEVGFTADLFVLNPPWRLFWHRDRLADLAKSGLLAVRDAFAGVEGGAPKGTIDSTAATLLMALDLCSTLGEGYLIGNNATLERLFFAPNAPHSAVAKHIWAHVVIPGNPMTGIDDCLWEKETQFATGVIYFARDHRNGPRKYVGVPGEIRVPDRSYQLGAELRNPHAATDPREAWAAAKERVAELNGRESRTPFNLWLNVGGRIRVGLSTFERRSTKINKKEAERLFRLDGKSPMELVLQRAQRDELCHVCERGGWRVEPALTAAIAQAVHDYHGARAPLYPLPEIQRLGYLDEQDQIECRADLAVGSEAAQVPGRLVFTAGKSYSIRTQTVIVKRTVSKPNPFNGCSEVLEFTGQELAIIIADGIKDPLAKESTAKEYCFMDAKLKADRTCEVTIAKAAGRGSDKMEAGDEKKSVDFTLQQLAAHFHIPEVPDVAAVNPEQYAANLATLTGLETLTNQLCLA